MTSPLVSTRLYCVVQPAQRTAANRRTETIFFILRGLPCSGLFLFVIKFLNVPEETIVFERGAAEVADISTGSAVGFLLDSGDHGHLLRKNKLHFIVVFFPF